MLDPEDYYFENGLMVFTERYHLKRGWCCGNNCRHCPYDHIAVPVQKAMQTDDVRMPFAVRRTLDACADACRALLGSAFVGAYVHGSLANGDYHEARSDVDFLVVSHEDVAHEVRRAVGAAFREADDDLPGRGLEASLTPLSSTRGERIPPRFYAHYSRTRSVVPTTEDGDVDGDLILHFATARACGIMIDGPRVQDVFAPVRFRDFVASLIDDFTWMMSDEQLARDPVYAILNACRLLVVASTRKVEVLSKIDGAKRALSLIDAHHRPLIQSTLKTYLASEHDQQPEVLDPSARGEFLNGVARVMNELATQTP